MRPPVSCHHRGPADQHADQPGGGGGGLQREVRHTLTSNEQKPA